MEEFVFLELILTIHFTVSIVYILHCLLEHHQQMFTKVGVSHLKLCIGWMG